MLLVSPTGAVIDAAPEAVECLIAHGFKPAAKPQTDEKPKPKKGKK